MLILEGPDMVGKTTLMPFLENLLREELDRTTFGTTVKTIIPKPTCEKYGLEEANYTTALQWMRRIKPFNICDRFALSEMIYGAVARGKPNITQEMYDTLMRHVKDQGGYVIMVCADPVLYEHLIHTVYPTRGEAFSEDVCRKVNLRYGQLVEGTDCDCKITLRRPGEYASDYPMTLRRAVRHYVWMQVRRAAEALRETQSRLENRAGQA